MAIQPTKKPVKFRAYRDIKEKLPKSGFRNEWAATKELFCEVLGMPEHRLDDVHIEGLRCRGNDSKERLFMRRIWQSETLFQDEGYFIQFFTASQPTRMILATIGPFDDSEHSEIAYDTIVTHFKFDKGLLINKPEDLDELFRVDDEDDLDGLFDVEDDVPDDMFDVEDEDEGLFDIEDDEDDLFGAIFD